jgi:protein HEXIM1/2
MSAEEVVAAVSTEDLERNMQPDDAGGGRDEGKDETHQLSKANLKRKSSENNSKIMPPSIAYGKKPKKMSKRRIKRHLKKTTTGCDQGFEVPKVEKSGSKSDSGNGNVKPATTTTNRTMRKRRATGSFNAPFNSTQFLMNDHISEAVKHLNSTLNVKSKPEAVDESSVDSNVLEQRPVRRITRARESSFSIDSDDDYYYSSPEDEEEFLNREFIKDYDNVRNDRLVDMTKTDLINEYLQMEQKIDALEKKLSVSHKALNKSTDDMTQTIQNFQTEIQRLETENDRLKSKRGTRTCTSCSTSSSSDSSSESSDSDSSSDDDSSSDSEPEEPESRNLAKPAQTDAADNQENSVKTTIDQMIRKALGENDPQDDTGYESGNSHKQNNTGAAKIDTLDAGSTTSTSSSKANTTTTTKLNASISVNCITSTSL